MISQDLLVEILLRLPVKSLARYLCVSKSWASIIRSRYFIKSYQSRCLSRQHRVMLAFRDMSSIRCHFFSSSQPPSFVTNATWCIDYNSFRKPDCVNGLICVEHMHRLWICNPITGKTILLPQSGPSKPFTLWYMGYDPINYQYKVLFFSKEGVNDPCKVEVFTLGDQGSWKMIEDGNFQTPQSRGICLNGFVYYGARTMHGSRIVRFDVRTEKFVNFIEKPVEAQNIYGHYLGFFNIMNYQGKPALLCTKSITKHDLWVLKDVEKQEWSKVSIFITREMCSFDLIWPCVVGFVQGSGELIVTARDRFDQFHLVYIDLTTNRSRKVRFEGIRCSYRSSIVVVAFTDYVESIMSL
ncbi:putative F-box protein [Cardamine amara subsp. amara]|uniref:F-box protein n=1 Tax=Cardamine amara subsp. amara TaxID=228776 RepID=A0ABD0ZYE0_CARAN